MKVVRKVIASFVFGIWFLPGPLERSLLNGSRKAKNRREIIDSWLFLTLFLTYLFEYKSAQFVLHTIINSTHSQVFTLIYF